MNDALAGDLLEEFARRGAAWYWRQVILAVVIGFFRRFRDEWVSVAFAVVWLFCLGEWVTRLDPVSPLWPGWIRLPWPWSLVSEVAHDIVVSFVQSALGLVIYLVLVRRFSLGGFTAGLGTAIAALTLAESAMTLLRGNQFHLYWFVSPTIYTLVLVFSIWVGQRGNLHSGSAT
jgi:hypothetical protein